MKFAKELERDAVPEWRIKYLNYKAGKKYVKTVVRAAKSANASPRPPGELAPSYYSTNSMRTVGPGVPKSDAAKLDDEDEGYPDLTADAGPTTTSGRRKPAAAPGYISIPRRRSRESEALTQAGNMMQYGSIVATPPSDGPDGRLDPDAILELPAPALQASADDESTVPSSPKGGLGDPGRRLSSRTASAYGSRSAAPEARLLPANRSAGTVTGSPSQLRRLLAHGQGFAARSSTRNDLALDPLDLLREKEADLRAFMDSELEKVESFYRLKEEQAGQRLAVLKEQLHEMRNRRIQEIAKPARSSAGAPVSAQSGSGKDKAGGGWAVGPIRAKLFPPGPNSQAFQTMAPTPVMQPGNSGDAQRDYIRRPENQGVSYRTAKRKLKLAVIEFYRELELLKSYALLNRTAFRKLNKKYDKAVNAHPPYRYMNERVNRAWFVRSDVIESHIHAVEDLYARYFERGNRKIAASKLRSLNRKHGDHSACAFRNGFLIGTGLVFSIQGLTYGAELLFDEDPDVRIRTSYLLQLYGGYFLVLALFSLFCLDCMIWTRNKINYTFIFEFDQRHLLDWRRIAEFPSFFLLLLGIFMWANFANYDSDDFTLYYPVILITLTVIIIFLPFPVAAHRARKWLAYSHWRLLLAGIYPVEFRDFFLGDMYCSLTYATANAELFFCLYTRAWNNPDQCNSSHSRVMGFLTALPPIWRFLQCIRRYKDTRNAFPHLANAGKYTMTILAALTLSLYRINGTNSNMALFISFSLINSFYASIWDIFMDFSLIQADSKHFALRDILALKKRWPYYAIMVVDPAIRFVWIFYAIFTHDRQHSTIVSFLVGFAEVIRRGLWALFRVENEHSSNVSQYKASRDIPLPYRIVSLTERSSAESSPLMQDQRQQDERDQPGQQQQQKQHTSGRPTSHGESEAGQVSGSSTAVSGTFGALRNRADTMSGRSFFKRVAEAHKQDFVKKRRSADEAEADQDEAVIRGGEGRYDDDDADDDDDDDDDDADDEDEVQADSERLRNRLGGA